jgi:hypothetical protein
VKGFSGPSAPGLAELPDIPGQSDFSDGWAMRMVRPVTGEW